MLDGGQVGDLSLVRRHTKHILESSFEADDPVLVEAPPNSGKTTAALQLAATSDTPVTYLCGRTDLYGEAKKKLEETNNDIDFVRIPSPHDDCPSFQEGSPGDQERLKKLYNKGYSGRKLHFLSKKDALTPCGDDCRYLQKLNKIENGIDEIDVLIGNHRHSHRDLYVNNRIVVLDEFNSNAFISSYPDPNSQIIDDPKEIVPAFLDSLANNDTGFPSARLRDFTDLLVQRDNKYVSDVAVEWFKVHGASRSDAEEFEFFSPSSFQHDRDHLLAPFLTLSILCMERVGPEIEMAPHSDSNILDIWEAANLNPSTRVVRNRNTSKMTILRPPDFSRAEQVIGLDATPTVALWNLLLPPKSDFDLRRVIKRSAFTEYLESALNMSIVQIGDGMHHYAGGRISTYDRERFRAVKAIENKKAPLISSKQAIKKYREEGLLDEFVEGIGRKTTLAHSNLQNIYFNSINFSSIRSSNTFKKQDLGMVFGTPYPGDDVIKRWAGLCGVGVDPQGIGDNKKFVDASDSLESNNDRETGAGSVGKTIGEEIYEHYVHDQVVQAILRFGRDKSVIENGGATVYVSTHALPSWFEATNELTISADDKKATIIEKLYEAFSTDNDDSFSYQTVNSIMKRVETTNTIDSISKKYVRDVLKSLAENDVAERREGYATGGADQYKWNPETKVESVLKSSVVCGTDSVYILNREL